MNGNLRYKKIVIRKPKRVTTRERTKTDILCLVALSLVAGLFASAIAVPVVNAERATATHQPPPRDDIPGEPDEDRVPIPDARINGAPPMKTTDPRICSSGNQYDVFPQ